MSPVEGNVLIAFLVQALVIIGIFGIAICWFSCISRLLPCQENSETSCSPEATEEADKKRNYPDDLPPTYSQADLFSQLEVRADDVLYPPPSYKDVSLPPIQEEEQVCDDPPPIPRLAFTTPANHRLQNYLAAPGQSCDIAVISEEETPCGLVLASRPPNPTASTASWLRLLFARLQQARRPSGSGGRGQRRRQTDHPWIPPEAARDAVPTQSLQQVVIEGTTSTTACSGTFENPALSLDETPDNARSAGPGSILYLGEDESLPESCNSRRPADHAGTGNSNSNGISETLAGNSNKAFSMDEVQSEEGVENGPSYVASANDSDANGRGTIVVTIHEQVEDSGHRDISDFPVEPSS